MIKQNYTHIHLHIPKSLLADCKMIAKAKGISLSEHIEQVLLDDAEHMKILLFSSNEPDLDDKQLMEQHRQIIGMTTIADDVLARSAVSGIPANEFPEVRGG